MKTENDQKKTIRERI